MLCHIGFFRNSFEVSELASLKIRAALSKSSASNPVPACPSRPYLSPTQNIRSTLQLAVRVSQGFALHNMSHLKEKEDQYEDLFLKIK